MKVVLDTMLWVSYCTRRHGSRHRLIERALKACSASTAIEMVPMDRFELERLISDLSSSINDLNGGKLQGQLLALCDRLEAAEQSGDGMYRELARLSAGDDVERQLEAMKRALPGGPEAPKQLESGESSTHD